MTNPRDLSLLRQIEFRVSNGLQPDPEYFHDGAHVLLDHFLHRLAETEPTRVARIRQARAALNGQPNAATKAPAQLDTFAVTVDASLEAPLNHGLLLRLARTLKRGGAIPGRIMAKNGVIGLVQALETFRGQTDREPEIAAALRLDDETPLHALAASILWDLRNRRLVSRETPHPDAVKPYAGVEQAGPTLAELSRLAHPSESNDDD